MNQKVYAIKSLFESETQIIEKDSHYFYPFCISTYLHIKLKTFSIQNIAFLTSVTIFLLPKHVVKVGKLLPFRRKTFLHDSNAWNYVYLYLFYSKNKNFNHSMLFQMKILLCIWYPLKFFFNNCLLSSVQLRLNSQTLLLPTYNIFFITTKDHWNYIVLLLCYPSFTMIVLPAIIVTTIFISKSKQFK